MKTKKSKVVCIITVPITRVGMFERLIYIMLGDVIYIVVCINCIKAIHISIDNHNKVHKYNIDNSS